MTNDAIFYTQISTTLAFIVAIFGLYRLLVSQKDSTIELLKERNRILEKEIYDLKNQSPDILAEQLGKRIEEGDKEILRLKSEGEEYQGQIAELERNRDIFLWKTFKTWTIQPPDLSTNKDDSV